MFGHLSAWIQRDLLKNTPACREVIAVYTRYEYNRLGFLGTVVGWIILLFVAVLLGLSVSCTVFTGLVSNAESVGGFAVIALIVAAVVSVWVNIRVRIVVCSEGLEFHGLQPGMFSFMEKPVFSTWTNLSHIAIVEEADGEGSVYRRFLYLKQPHGAVIDIGKVTKFPYRHYTTGPWWKKQQHYYAIDPYSLKYSILGPYLEAHAPQVIDHAGSELKRIEALVAKDGRH